MKYVKIVRAKNLLKGKFSYSEGIHFTTHLTMKKEK